MWGEMNKKITLTLFVLALFIVGLIFKDNLSELIYKQNNNEATSVVTTVNWFNENSDYNFSSSYDLLSDPYELENLDDFGAQRVIEGTVISEPVFHAKAVGNDYNLHSDVEIETSEGTIEVVEISMYCTTMQNVIKYNPYLATKENYIDDDGNFTDSYYALNDKTACFSGDEEYEDHTTFNLGQQVLITVDKNNAVILGNGQMKIDDGNVQVKESNDEFEEIEIDEVIDEIEEVL